LNILPESKTRSKFSIFVDQFKSLPVGLLSVAAGVSVLSGGLADAVAIMAVVGINAVIGFFTENAAEKTISSLKSLVRPSALVRRGSEVREIPVQEVLVGDILILKPGAYVAADARLLDADNLSVDESVLTGESLPAMKTVAALLSGDCPLAERSNMVYGGTLVTGGEGAAIVVSIGRFSEIGRVQVLVQDAAAPETLVERELNRTGNQLVILSSAVCAVVFFLGLLRGGGLLHLLKTSISLAVAAVPEGLPAVATTSLALGVHNMRRHKVLIRDLEAICTLGSVQTICLDKTGTLTLNRMSVVRLHCGMQSYTVRDGRFTFGGLDTNPFTTEELLLLIHICVLCNETILESDNGRYVLNGSPTENALIEMALSAGIDVRQLRERYPRLGTHYRGENRQYMSTLHSSSEQAQLSALKGSPLDVLAKCKEHILNGRRVPLTDSDKDLIEAENERMAGDALRVLGVAHAIDEDPRAEDDGCGLIWLGLVGMADPVRSGVKESIKAFHSAGVDTVMITGDQSLTAYAVGKELELNDEKALNVLDSEHLRQADPSHLKALCTDVNVFSRVSPANKLQIVQALQSAGKVVAMTGDGINDGPALKAADVGIAMGSSGTDVAREIAEVVLEEDELETLIVALSDGRTIYNNIRKALHYLLATNTSEILLMTVAVGAGLGYPLNAMQLLWINLISDIFPGLALTLEPPEPDVLSRPPRDPSEPIVRRRDLKRIGFEGATMTLCGLGAYGYGILKYGRGPAAGTLAFQGLTVSQILHAISCRSDTHSIFDRDKLPPNKFLTMATVGSLGLQVLTQMAPGLRNLLGLSRIGIVDGIFVGAAALISLIVSELSKTGHPGDNL
jgi:Ca2+-transporting ATPase